MPAKLNTVIQPLMGSLRREPEALLRAATADALAQLAALCCARIPSPNDRSAGRPSPQNLWVSPAHTSVLVRLHALFPCQGVSFKRRIAEPV